MPPEDIKKLITAAVASKDVRGDLLKGNVGEALATASRAFPHDTINPSDDEIIILKSIRATSIKAYSQYCLNLGLTKEKK